MGRRAVEGAVRVPLGGSVQFVARPRDGACVPRRDPAGRGRQARPLLLDVRPEVLQYGAHAAGARLRPPEGDRRAGGGGSGDGGKVGGVSEEGGAVCENMNLRVSPPPALSE